MSSDTSAVSESAGPTPSADTHEAEKQIKATAAGATGSTEGEAKKAKPEGEAESSTPPRLLFDPGPTKKLAVEAQRKAKGNADPVVIAQVKAIDDGVARLQKATGPLAQASGLVIDAAAAYAPFKAGIAKALVIPTAKLVQLLAGGQKFYARCRVRGSWWDTATNLLAQLPEGAMGLEPEDVEAVKGAVQAATPTYQAWIAAKEKRAPVVAEFTAAKNALEMSIKVLNALLEVERLKAKGASAGGQAA